MEVNGKIQFEPTDKVGFVEEMIEIKLEENFVLQEKSY